MRAPPSVEALGAEVARRRDEALAEPAHGARTSAVLGIALGASFGLCFLTGVLSHLIQHPPSWFEWSSRPAGFYRITQGVHVASGTFAIPLLLAKLWAVWPHLFDRLTHNAVELVHRITLVPLVAGALFMVFSGYANIVRWYPWAFFFPRAHFWVAWVTIGALVVHVAARAPVARQALGRDGAGVPPPVDAPPVDAPPVGRPRVSRRQLLGWSFGTATGLVVVTAGQTAPVLGPLTLLAPRRPDIGPQDLPVNQTAADAGVTESARDPAWALIIEVAGVERMAIDLASLRALPQRTAELPISCVEGWSRSAVWRGVPLRDVLRAAGVPEDGTVEAVSLEREGLYGRSLVEPRVWHDRDTLLALEVNGAVLDLDHGYPLRLIAPNRPGVMQTKWLERLVA